MKEKNTIGERDVSRAWDLLRRYRSGRAALEKRLVSDNRWWCMKNWEEIGEHGAKNDPRPASAWLFNSLANKHAEAMDSYPEPVVLPREEGDIPQAEILSSVLPVILESNRYEKVYSELWWSKLICGTAVTGVFWANDKQRGLGDIDIRAVDILSLYWEPGIKNIQDSANVFNVELADNDNLLSKYPYLRGKLGGDCFTAAEYAYDGTVDTTDKSLVVDWYYKKDDGNGVRRLHYCKFVGETLLYSSENDSMYRDCGWYAHGQYPFVFDTLFSCPSTPCGLGYIDIMKDTQAYIDRLNSVMLKNALVSSRVRYFVRADGSVNEKEFSDTANELVHVSSSSLGEDSIRQITATPLSGIYATLLQMKIDELKETSGNRDFTQGGTTGGVTSGTAINALQHAGNKLTRDLTNSAYRAFEDVCRMMIELVRQFYTEPRYFRILGRDGSMKFISYDNSRLAVGAASPISIEPVFDLKISSQRVSEYTREIQNETAQQLYSAGFFDPERAEPALCALDLMDFEGKSKVIARISENKRRAEAIYDTGELQNM